MCEICHTRSRAGVRRLQPTADRACNRVLRQNPGVLLIRMVYMMTTQITLLGCGLMGAPMARRLRAAGFPLTVWNRTRHKAAALEAAGAVVADSPAQAVANADIVITMLEHGGVVQNVLFDQADAACHGLRRGTLLIDMGSILPEQAQSPTAHREAETAKAHRG